MTSEKIFIIGAGAIGKVLAVALQNDNKPVVLLRGSVTGQPPSVQDLRVECADGTEAGAAVQVDTLDNFTTLDGLVVLTNKSYGNPAVARALRDKAPGASLLLLQNGLGVEQPFLDHGFANVYRCVLFVTSQPIDENRLRFKPVAVSPVGVIRGSTAALERVVAQVHSPFFPFRAERDIQPVIWKKAIVNCVFNSVCPLLEADNGVFRRDPAALAIAQRVIGECVAVARESGIALSVAEVTESLLLISKASEGQFISTLQDIRNRRRTEIDTLNFEIVRIAQRLGMGDRVQETRLLGELTRLKADLSERNAGTV